MIRTGRRLAGVLRGSDSSYHTWGKSGSSTASFPNGSMIPISRENTGWRHMEIQLAAETCGAICAAQQRLEAFPGKEIALGSLKVSRVLPVRDHRSIGPWCFLDRFGPLSFTEGSPMDVAPHPHMGLQTVTWLLEGEVVHDDSLGQEAVLRPGGVNVMTLGHAIAPAERKPKDNWGRMTV